MIKPTKIDVQLIEHFNPQDESLGFLNDYESLDLRCQIAEQKAEGYYLKFNGLKVSISEKGRLETWHNGLYDINEINFARLFKATNKQ
jgi:hypothetical protein